MGYRFDNSSVIVTGAARGSGLAIARRFVRAGAAVMMADRDERKLEAEVETLNGEGHDGRATPFFGDVTESLAVKNLMAATFDAHDRLDVLVNAARTVAAIKPLDDDGLFETMLAQNVCATFRLCRIAAKRMIDAAEGGKVEGAIVNVSSIYARRAPPSLLGYSVACAALDQLTRGLALALAPKGIRVNAVAIGSIPGRSIGQALAVEDLPRALARATPLGRAGQGTEVAEAALYLAAPAASFVTGEILTVDGGRHLRDVLDADEG